MIVLSQTRDPVPACLPSSPRVPARMLGLLVLESSFQLAGWKQSREVHVGPQAGSTACPPPSCPRPHKAWWRAERVGVTSPAWGQPAQPGLPTSREGLLLPAALPHLGLCVDSGASCWQHAVTPLLWVADREAGAEMLGAPSGLHGWPAPRALYPGLEPALWQVRKQAQAARVCTKTGMFPRDLGSDLFSEETLLLWKVQGRTTKRECVASLRGRGAGGAAEVLPSKELGLLSQPILCSRCVPEGGGDAPPWLHACLWWHHTVCTLGPPAGSPRSQLPRTHAPELVMGAAGWCLWLCPGVSWRPHSGPGTFPHATIPLLLSHTVPSPAAGPPMDGSPC